AAQENPGRGRAACQQHRLAFIKPIWAKDRRGPRGQGAARGAGPNIDGNGHEAGYIGPALPAMKVREAVGPHDPDKSPVRQGPGQIVERIEGVGEAVRSFKTGDADARIADLLPGGADALLET